MNEARIRRSITQRLSLRRPQEQALDILAEIVDQICLVKDADVEEALAKVRALQPQVESFERDFPSLCFALATGVGKTRLMGAFVSYLFLTERSKNFFVLAPNTTIYNKLIEDFSRHSSPKYVFRGISQFAQVPPLIVTGDDWEEGRGVRGSDLSGAQAIINIFNVDKINKDKGRIRSFRETVGASYFDYLAGLPDLVLLMDEAHRYRGSAGMRAVNELRPALGLELTATPKTVGAKPVAFRNVVYSYPLGEAMADGLVKEPAVATRADFRREAVTADRLEGIMLEDGVRCHEHAKVELDLYARQSGRRLIHPFMLVVAQHVEHAKEIRARIETDGFFGGAYKGRVAEVHSALKGEESDEAVARLVGLESDDRTEIVIHVNKLKEGWDVSNLFTILPLRASASEILTEQTLGRGLRLPYGERTGVEAVDTLTVIAHDCFDEVIRRAREEDTPLRIKALTIGPGGDIPAEREQILTIPPIYAQTISLMPAGGGFAEEASSYLSQADSRIVAAVMDVISAKYERRLQGGTAELLRSDIQAELAADVEGALRPAQGTLPGLEGTKPTHIVQIVGAVTKSLVENLIEIPEIVVIPSREVNFWFSDFDLEGLAAIRFQPLSDRILIRNLRDDLQRELNNAPGGAAETRVENHIVRHLIDFNQVDYDAHADLLHKLAEQVVKRLRAYLVTETDVENVALVHGKELARFIFEQMMQHYHETPTDYRTKLVRAFRALKPVAISIGSADRKLPLGTPAKPLSETRSFVFTGTSKSAYDMHRFQSDTERRFALLLERPWERTVLRWIKPGPGQFGIEYRSGRSYEPDFVAETVDRKLIIEIKADNQMLDQTVREKANAASRWVRHANELAAELGTKPWAYVLVPESAVTESATVPGLLASHSQT